MVLICFSLNVKQSGVSYFARFRVRFIKSFPIASQLFFSHSFSSLLHHTHSLTHTLTYRVILDCPPGRYGRAERLTDGSCTGVCAKGHYCPAGSVTSTQYPCPIGERVCRLLPVLCMLCAVLHGGDEYLDLSLCVLSCSKHFSSSTYIF